MGQHRSYTSSHPHAPTKIAGTDDVHKGGRTFEYDKNGNQLGFDVISSGQKRSIVWDEENRIQEIHDNGRTSRFKYNDAGERVIKRTEQGETAYVNQFWTVRNRSVGTKHIFVGETRIASKLVPGEDHVQPESLWSQTLGGWWKQLSQGQKPFKNPHFTGSNMPQKLPEDNFVYFYHPDHVGSTSYVTDKDGELYEHVQYFPFGETWVHEHSNTEKLPYLYTSKELDEETGLYYFGARYYDPRTSVWQSADPMLTAYLDPPHDEGAVGLPKNLALFAYAWHTPIVLHDPTGLQVVPPAPGRPTSPEDQARRDAERRAQEAQPKSGWQRVKENWGKVAAVTGVVVVVVATLHPKTRQIARQLLPQSGRHADKAGQAIQRGGKNLAEILGRDVKKVVEAVNRGEAERTALTPEQRRAAADFFRQIAGRTQGQLKNAAAKFNQLRADYLEGKTNEVPGSLRDFIKRHRLPEE